MICRLLPPMSGEYRGVICCMLPSMSGEYRNVICCLLPLKSGEYRSVICRMLPPMRGEYRNVICCLIPPKSGENRSVISRLLPLISGEYRNVICRVLSPMRIVSVIILIRRSCNQQTGKYNHLKFTFQSSNLILLRCIRKTAKFVCNHIVRILLIYTVILIGVSVSQVTMDMFRSSYSQSCPHL